MMVRTNLVTTRLGRLGNSVISLVFGRSVRGLRTCKGDLSSEHMLSYKKTYRVQVWCLLRRLWCLTALIFIDLHRWLFSDSGEKVESRRTLKTEYKPLTTLWGETQRVLGQAETTRLERSSKAQTLSLIQIQSFSTLHTNNPLYFQNKNKSDFKSPVERPEPDKGGSLFEHGGARDEQSMIAIKQIS